MLIEQVSQKIRERESQREPSKNHSYERKEWPGVLYACLRIHHMRSAFHRLLTEEEIDLLESSKVIKQKGKETNNNK